MSAEGSLSHFPDPGWACYTADGAAAASKSNLSLGESGPTAVDGLMDDFGASNLAVGHRRWIGRDMNRALDAIVGGWSVSAILTFQTGTPLTLGLADARLADGTQRPDVTCSQLTTGIGYHQAAATGLPILNESCFGRPGDEVPGDAPRYFSNLRSNGIHNSDLSFSKAFMIREGMKLQIRGEFFNFTNTPRFAPPNTSVGDSQFGQVTSTLGSPRHTQIGVRFEF